MSIVADFSVPVDSFCLGEALQADTDVTVTLDRVVAHSPDYVMPFVWALDTDRETFEAALADDPTVETAEVTDSFDTAHLYQMTWAETVSERLAMILDHDGVILEAHGTGTGWRFEVRFGSREHFADFQDHFERFGAVTLHRIRSPEIPGDVTYGVSRKQRDALLVALDAGYYDTPSEATGEEVADQVGISQQALSTRLQRGTRTLLENTLGRHRDE